MGSTNRFWSLAQRRYGSGSEPGEHLGKGPSHSACPARTPAACALIAQRAAAVAAPKMEVMAACVVISEVGVEVPEMGEVAGVSAERSGRTGSFAWRMGCRCQSGGPRRKPEIYAKDLVRFGINPTKSDQMGVNPTKK